MAARVSTPQSPLSVVLVSFNTREDTLRSIRSLYDYGVAGIEIIVVDNGSRDDSVTAIRSSFPDVVVIEAGENLGFARGVNRGAAAATGEYILLFNPDAILLAQSLQNLLDFAREHPEYRLYGGRNMTPDGANDLSSCWGAPSLWSLLCFATGLSTAFPRSAVFDPESLGQWQRDTVREVPIITGSLLLISRADWLELGGMDEKFFLYGDDAEFSLRAKRHGFRPVIVPTATIIHDKGGSTSNSGTKMSMVMAGKVTLLNVMWKPLPAKVGITLLQAGSALRGLLEAWTNRNDRTWLTVWKRRQDWREGYPHALKALFGIEEH